MVTLERRFVGLTVLRWLPTGFLIPATALLMQSRGLSLAEIGFVSAVQGVVVLVLELPTGGLADSLGRRRVLLVANAIDLASLALFALAQNVAAFAVAWAIQGVYRALDSGPLEAWYVDACFEADPGADIERGLARSGMAVGAGISAGALGTALLVGLGVGGGGTASLVVPVVVALVLRALSTVAVAIFVIEPHRDRLDAMAVHVPAATLRRDLRRAAREVPDVVRGGLRLVGTHVGLRALVLIEVLWGAGMLGVELYAGPRLSELVGGAAEGAVLLGITAAIAWSVCAAGSGMTTRIVTRAGSPARAGFALRIAQGAAVAIAAVAGGPAGLITAYLGFYLVHGAANAVHYGMVHRLVPASQRATILSISSLASRLGGVLAGLGVGWLASAAGLPAAFAASAVLLAAAAPLYTVAGRAADALAEEPA